MIRSFRHRGLKRLYERGERAGIRADLIGTVENILFVLDEAQTVQALAIPRYRLHSQIPLALAQGRSKGLLVSHVKANWRIIFRFEDGQAYDVDLVDYH